LRWRHEADVRALAGSLCCLLLAAASVAAQPRYDGRTAVEAVAAFASTSDAPDDPFVWLDLAGTFRLRSTLDVVVRPYARRLPGGDWDVLLYQAQVRYQPGAGVRIDAGIITSPLGLGALELRPDMNPVVSYPFYYFAQLPRFDRFANEVQLLSGGYPFGAMVSWSDARWDARAGVTDSTPARSRNALTGRPASTPQFIAGGGFTPVTGLRFGAGLASGKYRTAADDDYFDQPAGAGPITDADAVVFNVEAEYAFRYTRLSGEWVRDRFDSDGAAVVSRGFYVQAVHTLSPRLFAATRVVRASTPVIEGTAEVRRTRSSAELTAGYRLTPRLTLKAGYQTSHSFANTNWNHAAVWSLVWAQRWF
jgi:hypothetical protein